MMDRTGDPWAGTTYNGFSGMSAAPARPPPRRTKGPWIGAGLAVAAALGLGFGVLTREDLGEEPPPPDPPLAEASQAAVPVEVAAPTLPPAARNAAPLEVLPPDMARAAAVRVAQAPAVRAAPAVTPPAPREVAIAPKPVEVAQAPPAVPASARAPEPAAPRADPGFNCRYASLRSERLVCGDADLARLDRRLNRAFEEAVASGIPYRELRRDQDDWLRIREDAARRAGPGGVASVYRQRIAELREMAGGY